MPTIIDITGVYCSVDLMVTVPLDAQGDETKEGEAEIQGGQGDDALSVAASICFGASLPVHLMFPVCHPMKTQGGNPWFYQK